MSDSEPRTLAELFLLVADRDDPECLLHKEAGTWQPISSGELAEGVRKVHRALQQAGIQKGDRVVLLAHNGPHWPMIDFACLTLGAILVPVYPTLTAEQAAFIAGDCGARMAFIQGAERLQEMSALKAEMSSIEHFVLIGSQDEEAPADSESLTRWLAETEPADASVFEQSARAVEPDDLATFIYTSGTTGRPKGVMLTHANIASNVSAALEVLSFDDSQTALCFLPLSHSFERTVDYCYFLRGVTIAYAESVHAVSHNLMEIRPHIFVSVPRVYEKVLAKVQEGVAHSSAVKQALFGWAVGIGRKALPHRLAGSQPPGLLGLQLRLADRLVFSKIKARLGGRFEFAVSGGAPLAPEVATFFWGAGIPIFEGYGLSETSPVLAVNHPKSVRLGTVGPAIPGVELRIAEDGEILARGPNIMRGYHGLDDETAKAIDSEGWFHTGDIGEFDESWHLKITDRKKEIIVNAYGKNIAPAPIENALKASPYIGHVVIIGDKRKFLSALLVPDFDTLSAWCSQQGVATDDWSATLDDERVVGLFSDEVARINAELSSYQQLRAWELLPDDFTIETGELTPTQKIKRRVVAAKYREIIDHLYLSAERAAEKRAAEKPAAAEGADS